MKKLCLILMTVVLCVGLLTAAALALTGGTAGGEVTWAYDGETETLVIAGTGDMTWSGYYHDTGSGSVWVEVYNAAPWRSYRGSAVKAAVADGVTNLYKGAFKDFTFLREVTIPASVTAIEYEAFYNCPSLTDIYFAGSELEWYNMTGQATVPAGVNMHYGKNSGGLMGNEESGACWEFDAASGMLSIWPAAEDGTGAMTWSGYYQNNFDENGDSTGSEWIDVCDAVPWRIFRDRIETVVIADGVTNIYKGAFKDCPALKEVTVPESVTSVEYKAFYNSDALTDIWFADSELVWTNITPQATVPAATTVHYAKNSTGTWDGGAAWEYDDAAKTLTISGTGSMTWSGYYQYNYDENGDSTGSEFIQVYDAVPWRIFRDRIETVVIADGVTNIYKGAFKDCAA